MVYPQIQGSNITNALNYSRYKLDVYNSFLPFVPAVFSSSFLCSFLYSTYSSVFFLNLTFFSSNFQKRSLITIWWGGGCCVGEKNSHYVPSYRYTNLALFCFLFLFLYIHKNLLYYKLFRIAKSLAIQHNDQLSNQQRPVMPVN